MKRDAPEWLESPSLSTNPDEIDSIPQLQLLDGLKVWTEKHLPFQLTNAKLGELLLGIPRNQVEAWRTDPSASTYRAMPLRYKVLLVYRLLDAAGPYDRRTSTPKKVSDEEIQFIQENSMSMGPAEMAKQLDRPLATIRLIKKKLGIQHREWVKFSRAEEAFIQEHIADKGVAWIARHLPGRRYSTINAKAKAMGLIPRSRAQGQSRNPNS
ncbi:hypothetical protein L5C70_08885 [Pseudomonas aeruginosa]|nr:hypothetical protein [Pseudomonas aeruginosa]MDG4270985.1 hypothetical protein [Pseudomonas aeruginosa]